MGLPALQIDDDFTEIQWRSMFKDAELWVPIDSIDIDRVNYQREAGKHTVQLVTASFNPFKFKRPLVTRHGNRYNCYDGGSRIDGLRARGWTGCIPVMVTMTNPHVEDEALAFLSEALDRTPITTANKFKARLAANDPVAVEMKRIANLNGLSISLTGQPTKLGVSAIWGLGRVYQAYGAEVYSLTCQVLRRAFNEDVRRVKQPWITALGEVIKAVWDASENQNTWEYRLEGLIAKIGMAGWEPTVERRVAELKTKSPYSTEDKLRPAAILAVWPMKFKDQVKLK